MKPLKLIRALAISALLFGGLNSAPAAVINVGPTGDYQSIVAALDSPTTMKDDEIVIQAGTYEEPDTLFVFDSLTLTGTNGPVIVHAPASVDAVIWIDSGKTNVVINNIIFERATANATWMRAAQLNTESSSTWNNCSFSGPAQGQGAIMFFGADAVFNSCTFSNFNGDASWASAIFMEGYGPQTAANLVVTNCTFEAGCNQWIKTADFDGWTPEQSRIRVSKVDVRNSTFKAARWAQALKFRNGGKLSIEFDPTQELLFQDCSFEGTTLEVAEFHYTTNTPPAGLRFSRCKFNAYNSGRKMFWMDLPTPNVFEDCLFAGGQHQTIFTFWGGPPSVDFYQCTMINDGIGGTNSTFINGWDGGRTFNIVNSLFRCPVNFTPGFVCDPSSTGDRNYAIANSVIDHPTPVGAKAKITPGPGYSNASLAAAFVNEAARDYHLVNGSPWVNGGSDLGYTLDLDQQPRNQGGAPDMGAYESPYSPVATPTLSMSRNGNSVTLTYTGVLQAADKLPGTFGDVSGASSPWTVPTTNTMQVFRARSATP